MSGSLYEENFVSLSMTIATTLGTSDLMCDLATLWQRREKWLCVSYIVCNVEIVLRAAYDVGG